MYHAITKQKFKQLWKVSLPLMLSYLSTVGMMFIDRLFLANYSMKALSATVSAGIFAFGFTMGVEMITLISSVFVSQHHGAKNYHLMGKPIWQMIWFSLFSVIIFMPLGMFLGPIFFSSGNLAAEQQLVFRCIMFVSPLWAMTGALQSFFNGQQRTLIVTYICLVGNIVNAVLDPVFIFGIEGFIPSMGIIGANIATAIGVSIQIILFFGIFLQKQNRDKCNTWDFGLDLPVMYKCIRVGLPEAIGVAVEVCCWGLFYNMMAKVSDVHVIVVAVANSVVMLFLFFGIGLEQGCSVVVGNLIGADKKDEIKYVFRAGMGVIGVNAAITVGLFLMFPGLLIDSFFSGNNFVNDHVSLESATQTANIAYSILKNSIVWVAIYLAIENVRWLINGVLRAGGDTYFLLVANVVNILVLMILPTYVVMVIYQMPVITFFAVWIFFAVTSSFVSYTRFSRGRWLKLDVNSAGH